MFILFANMQNNYKLGYINQYNRTLSMEFR
jgi:hypothetical protein